MLPNGLLLALDMALRKNEIQAEAMSDASRKAYGLWVLGMFREDVVLYPGLKRATPSPSGGHIWPFASFYFMRLYFRAVRLMRRGKTDRAHFELGRAIHVLIDMACPSHSHPAWHCSRDPFERYVESHAFELAHCEIPALDPDLDQKYKPDVSKSAFQLIRNLIRCARRIPADHTQSPWGRWLRKKGILAKPDASQLAEQTRYLMPLAAAHLSAMFKLFEQDTKCQIF